jgi:hypothetical protein
MIIRVRYRRSTDSDKVVPEKNREEGLTAAEEEEVDAYRLVNHVMILLKARRLASLRT